MKIESYKINRKHRNQVPQPTCTQWSVSEWDEIRLFSEAKLRNWICKNACLWAMEKIGSNLIVLGTTGIDSAYIAKYVSDHNHEWHGYPVTPSRTADRPPTSVLDSWRDNGLISKSQQGKITRGTW